MIKDTASREIPFPREVLIDAARLFARGAEWEAIATATGAAVGDLVTFSIDHPEVWGPLFERAEKLRLAEAEGETIKGLCMLLKGDDETAAENAARELLIHRRHVERRRYQPPRHKDTKNLEVLDAAETARGTDALSRDPGSNLVPWCLGGEEEAPEELRRRITYAAHRVAHGDDYHRIARETGHPEIDVTRWAFIYARAWDRAYPTARRSAAQAGASRAINRLLVFVTSPDLKQAARAGRTLLVHRRHMHWAQTNQPQNRAVTSPGENAGTYPSSVTQDVVAIPGDGSLKVARRSGPARATGAVRPSAPRPRDGPC